MERTKTTIRVVSNRWEHSHIYFAWLKGTKYYDSYNQIRQSPIHQHGGFSFCDMLPASIWEHSNQQFHIVSLSQILSNITFLWV